MPQIIFVTGMSGAGRSTALNCLEDFGFTTLDNLPPRFLPALLLNPPEGEQPPERLAIGLDARSLQHEPEQFLQFLQQLRQQTDATTELLYLTADDDILVARYSETRRKHPLAMDRPILDGIAAERKLLLPIRHASDRVIDSTRLTTAEFRRQMKHAYGKTDKQLSLTLMSFSYAVGLPRNADLVFDVRFLRNPHYDEALRPFTGLDTEVGRYIAADPNCLPFLNQSQMLLETLLPAYFREGKSYLTIAFGCTGGKHRSVYITEQMARWCERHHWSVLVQHRDIPTEKQ